MQHVKTKVLVYGNYVDIDSGCAKMIKLFNYMGLTTKYCCENDLRKGFYIQFHEDIIDEQIETLLISCLNEFGHTAFKGSFRKWCRPVSGKIFYNWTYVAKDIKCAEHDYMKIGLTVPIFMERYDK